MENFPTREEPPGRVKARGRARIRAREISVVAGVGLGGLVRHRFTLRSDALGLVDAVLAQGAVVAGLAVVGEGV